jgi:hypothetical protein
MSQIMVQNTKFADFDDYTLQLFVLQWCSDSVLGTCLARLQLVNSSSFSKSVLRICAVRVRRTAFEQKDFFRNLCGSCSTILADVSSMLLSIRFQAQPSRPYNKLRQSTK